jgi:transketolase
MVEMREAYGRALADYGAQNERVVVLDADVSASTRSRHFAQRFPQRFFNVGITEAAMVDVAAGLALAGFIPFAHTFAFLLSLRAAESVRTCVAYARTNVKLIGAYGGLSDSYDGPTHHAICDLALMRSLPNMAVVVPADAEQAVAAIPAVAEWEGPVYLRLSRAAVPSATPPGQALQIGRGQLLREGSDVLLINCGVLLSRCLQAAQELESKGISAAVLNMPTLKPLDEELILNAASRCSAVVTIEEHNIIGGLGSAVAELLGQENPLPIRRVGIRDTFAESGPYEALLDRWGMSVADIVAAAEAALAQSKKHCLR